MPTQDYKPWVDKWKKSLRVTYYEIDMFHIALDHGGWPFERIRNEYREILERQSERDKKLLEELEQYVKTNND